MLHKMKIDKDMAEWCINIPKRTLTRYIDLGKVNEIAAWAIIKRTYANSLVYDFSVDKVQKIFHCSRKTAVKYRRMLIESDLFIYNPKKKVLFAKSLKSTEKREFGRKRKFMSASDYCIKFWEDVSTMRLHDVVVLLEKNLIEQAMEANRKRTLNKLSDSFSSECVDPTCGEPMFLRQFGSVIGRSKTTTWRRMNELVKDVKVSKTRIVAELVCPWYSDERFCELRHQYPHAYLFVVYSQLWHNRMIFLDKGSYYSLIDDMAELRFKHVIYKHPTRIHHIAKKTQQKMFEGPDGRPDFCCTDLKLIRSGNYE